MSAAPAQKPVGPSTAGHLSLSPPPHPGPLGLPYHGVLFQKVPQHKHGNPARGAVLGPGWQSVEAVPGAEAEHVPLAQRDTQVKQGVQMF